MPQTNRATWPWPAIVVLMLFVTPWLMGCEVVEGIFKAGVWVALIGVAVVLALVFAISRLFSRGT